MAIYTRTGDAGSTSLFTGQRVSKTHPRVEAYGTLDELNAMLSLCVCAVAEEEQRTLLEALQQHIFWFSAELASDSEQPSPGKRYISSEEIALLEQTIDREMARVPALHQFVLPGRCEAASRLHCPHRCQTGGAPAGRAGGRGYYPSDTAALSEPLI